MRLPFERGTLLAEPQDLLEGTGRRTRHVVIRPGDPVPEEALRALLEEALRIGSVRAPGKARGGISPRRRGNLPSRPAPFSPADAAGGDP